MTITDDLQRSWADELDYGSASEEGVIRIIEMAKAAKLDINARSLYFDETPLHFVADRGYVKAGKILLSDSNIKVDAVSGDDGGTPLHNAALGSWCDCPEMVKLLLDHGANPNALDDENNTPLHMAARGDCVEAAEMLINKGANVNALNKENKTALDLAIEYRACPKMMKLLARAEATAPVRIGQYSLTAKALEPNVLLSVNSIRTRE